MGKPNVSTFHTESDSNTLKPQKVNVSKDTVHVKPLIKIRFKPYQYVCKCTLKPEKLQHMLQNFSGIERKDSFILF